MNNLSMASPRGAWGVVPEVQISAFSEVMSEQLTQELSDEGSNLPPIATEDSALTIANNEHSFKSGSQEEDNDYLIAKLLQEQFNFEHDEYLKRFETSRNGNRKVAISYEKHCLCSPTLREELHKEDSLADDGEDMEDEDDVELMVDSAGRLVRVDAQGKPMVSLGRNGYSGKGKDMRTKHDLDIAQRRNVSRVVNSFEPSFAAGDLDGLSSKQLSNRVYNQLKTAEQAEMKRRVRLREPVGEDFATVEKAVDARTRRILFRLLQQDRLKQISGVVSSGKESVVLYAQGGSGQTVTGKYFPPHCAIKVFKTTLTEFRHRRMYVESDYRFKHNDLKKRQNPRKVVRIWAAKEAMNLGRIRKSGLPCPEPVLVRDHVLVMQFVGSNPSPDPAVSPAVSPSTSSNIASSAPTLHHCASSSGKVLTLEQWQDAYQQVKQHVHHLYHLCRLIHADLSEYNLLWHEGRVWIIDVSQAVDVNHKHAWEFLRRDCSNVAQFFRKVLPPEEVTPYEDLFNQVTSANIRGYGDEFMNNFALYLSTLRAEQAVSTCTRKNPLGNAVATSDTAAMENEEDYEDFNEEVELFDVMELMALRQSCLMGDDEDDSEDVDDDDDDE